MSASTSITPPSSPPPPPKRAPYVVTWDQDGVRCRTALYAPSPEAAAADALLLSCGPTRPAGAPEEVAVDGVAYQVDEWIEAAVYLVPSAAPLAVAALHRARRTLAHAEAAALSAAQLCHAYPATSPLCADAREATRCLETAAARLRGLVADLERHADRRHTR